jgi:Phage integrase, N-terminal SAM-like domain
VTSNGADLMSKLNAQNERIKRDYLRYLKGARGRSEATLDAVRKALARFEAYTGARDFKTFRREQAIGFKERLGETHGQRTGETLSLATQTVTLSALKEFFTWLAWQPGFKSKIHVPDRGTCRLMTRRCRHRTGASSPTSKRTATRAPAQLDHG